MISFKKGDIVQCVRAGCGDFKIVDIRKQGTTSEEVRLRSTDTGITIGWMYSTHVSCKSADLIRRRIDNAVKIGNQSNRKKKKH